MNYEDFTISKKQSEYISSFIFNDITSFIEQHKTDYEKWLKQYKDRS